MIRLEDGPMRHDQALALSFSCPAWAAPDASVDIPVVHDSALHTRTKEIRRSYLLKALSMCSRDLVLHPGFCVWAAALTDKFSYLPAYPYFEVENLWILTSPRNCTPDDSRTTRFPLHNAIHCRIRTVNPPVNHWFRSWDINHTSLLPESVGLFT